MKKLISLFLVITMLFLIPGCNFTEPEVEPEITQMRAICELATLECYYHNVAKYYKEGKNWWDKDKHFWIEYDGVVKIGVDASLISIEIDKNDVVTIAIPQAKVLDCTVNSASLTKDSYIVDSKSAKVTADDETQVMNEAKLKMEDAASADRALLENALESAKKLLENYVKNIGTCVGKEYTIVWKEATETTNNTTETSVESTTTQK